MITIRNLSKSYPRLSVLDRIDLTIPDGQIFALLGPNGSGKTTVLKSILEIVHPAKKSEILLDQKSVLGKFRYKNKVGYMPQFPKFPPHLKVSEIIALFEKLKGSQGIYKDKIMDDLEMRPFWGKAFGELSGGMAQKVNILQCFMFPNTVFILDEPTSGLDPQNVYYIKQLIRQKKSENFSVLFTSHVMAEVEELADAMALLVEGKVYTVVSPTALKQQRGSQTLDAALNLFWNDIKNHEKISS